MKPKRVQRKRTKGWRMPPNTIFVGRPGIWGNPFNWQAADLGVITGNEAKRYACEYFDAWLTRPDALGDIGHLEERRQRILERLHVLRGKNLACWCKPGQPCHADILLRLANE